MSKSRGFPLKGDLNGATFSKCWETLSAKRKQEVRLLAEGHDMTLVQVLNRWPGLRVEAK